MLIETAVFKESKNFEILERDTIQDKLEYVLLSTLSPRLTPMSSAVSISKMRQPTTTAPHFRWHSSKHEQWEGLSPGKASPIQWIAGSGTKFYHGPNPITRFEIPFTHIMLHVQSPTTYRRGILEPRLTISCLSTAISSHEVSVGDFKIHSFHSGFLRASELHFEELKASHYDLEPASRLDCYPAPVCTQQF